MLVVDIGWYVLPFDPAEEETTIERWKEDGKNKVHKILKSIESYLLGFLLITFTLLDMIN